MSKTKDAGMLQSSQSRSMIMDALLQLLQENSFQKLTVKEVCDRAGVSRMTFYRYYHTIEEVFSCYLDRLLEEYYKGVTIQDDYTENIRFMMHNMPFSKNLLRIIQKQGLQKILTESLLKYIARSSEQDNFYHMLGRRELDAYHLHFISDVIVSVLMVWAERGFKESQDELTEIYRRLLRVDQS
jgi:AcrR family transcriptional regulator